VGWLREIGFQQADCYFKWLELAVFGGQKPVGT
jgi:tRNA (cmo5U34)-methyltransferase